MITETVTIPWKTFDEERPKCDVWIYVAPPKDGFIDSSTTVYMCNFGNQDGANKDGVHFFYKGRIRYVKSSGSWKWCYKTEVKTNV